MKETKTYVLQRQRKQIKNKFYKISKPIFIWSIFKTTPAEIVDGTKKKRVRSTGTVLVVLKSQCFASTCWICFDSSICMIQARTVEITPNGVIISVLSQYWNYRPRHWASTGPTPFFCLGSYFSTVNDNNKPKTLYFASKLDVYMNVIVEAKTDQN